MFRVIHLVKRKPHLTHAQFRAHFERSHAAMALKYCGHLFESYERNYVDQVYGGGDPRVAGSGFGPMAFGWDLLSVWTLKDAAAFAEVTRMMESDWMQKLFFEDEERFIDRQQIMMLPCTAVCDTGTTFRPEGTVFDTPDGEPSWDGWEAKCGMEKA
ncbi:MAG: EthD domain-containing protein [Sphingomonadales bacterium]|nr:EthD domain-containing protein [Sphingomonadales bacterium]